MTARPVSEAGHTILELLVAASVFLVVMSALVSVLGFADGALLTEPDAADLQRRAREAVALLYDDLAGVDVHFAAGRSPETRTSDIPAILPCRLGATGRPSTQGLCAERDAITVFALTPRAVQCETALPALTRDAPIMLALGPGCPTEDAACGFEEGMRVLIAGDDGAWETIAVTGVPRAPPRLEHADAPLSGTVPAGSRVGAVGASSYYLDTDAATGVSQLMRRHVGGNAMPLVDHVVGLQFEYFGAAEPPTLVEPAADETPSAERRITYGPSPPALVARTASQDWPPGENCVIRVDDGRQLPRLAQLEPVESGLAVLDPGLLNDGPWCPGPSSPNRYDADLLRIRRIRVTLRLEAATPALRWPADVRLTRSGGAPVAGVRLPERRIVFDVAPRNLRRP